MTTLVLMPCLPISSHPLGLDLPPSSPWWCVNAYLSPSPYPCCSCPRPPRSPCPRPPCQPLSSHPLGYVAPPGAYPSPYPLDLTLSPICQPLHTKSTAPARGNPAHSPDYSHWPQFTQHSAVQQNIFFTGRASLMVSGKQWWQFLGLAEGGLTLLDQARSRLPWHIHTRPRSQLLKLTFILTPNRFAPAELTFTDGQYPQGKGQKRLGSRGQGTLTCLMKLSRKQASLGSVTYTDCTGPVNYTSQRDTPRYTITLNLSCWHCHTHLGYVDDVVLWHTPIIRQMLNSRIHCCLWQSSEPYFGGEVNCWRRVGCCEANEGRSCSWRCRWATYHL